MVIFPQNGRVVIVDNDIYEAQPLMKTFSKKNIRFSYFSGDVDQLPDGCSCDIRFLFLDLQLTKGETNPKAVASNLCGVLKRIISTQNCPYILLVWSKQKDIFFETFLSTAEKDASIKKPIQYIDLIKSDYFKKGEDGKWELTQDEDKILKLIEGKIIDKLSSKHSFHLFTYWENLVYNSSNEIINSFSSFIESADDPDKKMWSIFHSLAIAHSGRQLKINDRNDVVQKALITFNSVLLDRLEKNIKLSKYPNDIPNFSKILINEKEYSPEINTRLLIDENENQVVPGSLFFSERVDIKGKILEKILSSSELYPEFIEQFSLNHLITESSAKKAIFDDNGNLNREYNGEFYKFRQCCIEKYFLPQCDLFFCEVSPSCDYSQKKLEMHRIIYGLKVPGKQINYLKDALFVYKTPLFSKNNDYYSLFFDLRFFSGMEQSALVGKKPSIRIRHELLVDLQSKIASHISRPGVTSLPDLIF